MNNELNITLPNGQVLIARGFGGTDYPCIQLLIKDGNVEDLLCFAEYNCEKGAGKELCIGAYCNMQEDTAYYESYYGGAGLCSRE